MFEITVSKVRCIEDTAGPGNDEPYVLVLAIDFASDDDLLIATPQSGVHLYGPFEDVNDEEIWGRTEVDVHGGAFWGFDGQPRDLNDPADVAVLAALCESDHDESFSNTVRAQVQSAMQGQIATYSASGMERDAILTRLPRDMEGHVDLALRTDLERDERLGPVTRLVLTQVDLDAASEESTTRTLKFKSDAEDSEYDVTFRISAGVGTSTDALTAASQNVRYAAIWEQADSPEWVARHGLLASAYQGTFDDLGAQGYRLTNVSVAVSEGRDYYAAIWEKKTGPAWVARHRMSSGSYQQAFDQFAEQGYQLVDVSAYPLT